MNTFRFFTLIVITLLVCALTALSKNTAQDSIVLAPHCTTLPVFDGTGDDTCWQNASWQTINQVWIPYGAKLVDSSDYYGRYKIVWSSTTNLLYFLIEVTDDVFVDGFEAGKTADSYNFDITEVFIDEDTSGGMHIFDGGGTNAENAYTYHIYADFPAIDQITTDHYVYDLDGTGWGQVINRDHSSHLYDFAVKKNRKYHSRMGILLDGL